MEKYDVLVIGGGLAGLSCALVLGRSLVKTCIVSTSHVGEKKGYKPHNFISNDRLSLKKILEVSRTDLTNYDSITQFSGEVISINKVADGFEALMSDNKTMYAKRIVFANGLTLNFENTIDGFSSCFGISIFNCPFCHGYEMQGKKVGILAAEESAKGLYKLLSRWSDNVMVIDQGDNFESSNPIESIIHESGHIRKLLMKNGEEFELDYLFLPSLKQFVKPSLPNQIGLDLVLNPQVDMPVYPTDQVGRSQVKNAYVIGDLRTGFSTLIGAANEGNILGMVLSSEIAQE